MLLLAKLNVNQVILPINIATLLHCHTRSQWKNCIDLITDPTFTHASALKPTPAACSAYCINSPSWKEHTGPAMHLVTKGQG